MNKRSLRIEPGETIKLRVNGRERTVPAGKSIAWVLTAMGYPVIRRTSVSREARGVFCGMGSCLDCVATVNGHSSVRTCITEATADMTIQVEDLSR